MLVGGFERSVFKIDSSFQKRREKKKFRKNGKFLNKINFVVGVTIILKTVNTLNFH